ncbi:hypothetical protein ACJ41O_008837 [Fusarium nematophilum]
MRHLTSLLVTLPTVSGVIQEQRDQPARVRLVDIDNGVLKGRFHLVDEHYFIQETDDAPLNRRCWVALERMLSRRIVHFASEQVIWDYARLTACEALLHGTVVWMNSVRVQQKMGCKHGSHFLTTPRIIDEGLAQWARIVNAYSACGLTVLGDKPIAILGVAEHLRNELTVEYCAGLWRSKLEIQLAWQVKQLQPDRSPRNDLAPSWSWISVNGEVELQQIDVYEGYDLEPLASITEVSLCREANGGRGEKLIRNLQMRCGLNQVRLEGDDQNYHLEGDGMEHARRAWADAPDVVDAEGLFFVPLFEIQMALSFQEKWKAASEIRGIIVQGVEGKPGDV